MSNFPLNSYLIATAIGCIRVSEHVFIGSSIQSLTDMNNGFTDTQAIFLSIGIIIIIALFVYGGYLINKQIEKQAATKIQNHDNVNIHNICGNSISSYASSIDMDGSSRTL